MNFLKDDEELLAASASPREPLVIAPQASAGERAVIAIYNRLGGLLQVLAEKTGVKAAAAVAVWFVESGALAFIPKRAVIRLEVHQLFELWGKRSRPTFDAHFRFGGHNKQPGTPWQNQEYRAQDSGVFNAVHHNQSSEYAALTLARVVANDEMAFLSTSIGGCQLMIGGFAMLGYQSASEMYDAFQTSETSHVLTFFDFCRLKAAPRAGDLVNYLQKCDWNNFAKFYNGSGEVQAYAARLKFAYDLASSVLRVPKAA